MSTPTDAGLADQLLADSRVMLRYAMDRGIEPDRSVLETVSAVGDDHDPAARLEALRSAYATLAGAVAPVTPATLRATQRRFWLLTQNTGVNVMAIVGLLALASLLMTFGMGIPFDGAGAGEADGSGATGRRPWLELLSIASAATVGSAFIGLSTARKFVTSRTFDPQRDQDYISRLLLGLIAGTIVGLFGRELLSVISNGGAPADPANGNGGGGGGQELLGLSTTALALIGGFSADAVEDLIRRIAETFRTLVRGSDESRAARQFARERARVVAELEAAHAAAKKAGATKEQLASIRAMIQKERDGAP
ncbi:MAG: hypothetical protein AAFR38_06470 [Planctomycetota bacterium]